MKIGNITIQNPLALAPMEAVNCKAFRLLCKEMGAGLIYTAQIDVDRFLEKYDSNPKEAIDFFLDIDKKESPIVVQISGSKPDPIKKSAQIIEKYADIIDINLGCCEGDVLGKKAGAYFIKHPNMIERTFKPMIDSVNCPVTAKIRIGWDDASINAVETSLILQSIGIKAIAIHGRTKKQGYRGSADWETIKQVREHPDITIPIIGSGDITKPGHVKSYLERGYCDMVMIGRYAKRDPSIFFRTVQTLNNEKVSEINKRILKDRFKELYKKQKRQKKSELSDHLNWLR